MSRLSRSVVGTTALIGPMGVATAASEHSRHGDERKGSIRAPTAHSTPMDALAEAILAFSPEARSTRSPTIAMLRAKAS